MKAKYVLFVLVVFLAVSAAVVFPTHRTLAQQPQHHQHGMTNNAVDGRTNPELIKDKDAYRMFFVAASSSLSPNSEPNQIRGVFGTLGIETDAKALQVRELLLNFKLLYEKAVSDFNTEVGTDNQPNLARFIQQRDSIVLETRQQLETILGATNSETFYKFIQAEKRQMIIGKADSGE